MKRPKVLLSEIVVFSSSRIQGSVQLEMLEDDLPSASHSILKLRSSHLMRGVT